MTAFTFNHNGRDVKLNFPARKPFVVVFFTGKRTPEVTYSASIWEAMEVYRLDESHFPRRRRYLLDVAGWLYHVQGDLLHRATRINTSDNTLSDKHQRQVLAASREWNIPRYELYEGFNHIDREIWSVVRTDAQSTYDVVRDRIRHECLKAARLDGNAATADKLEAKIMTFLNRYGVSLFFGLNSIEVESVLMSNKMPVAAKYILYTVAQDVQDVVYYHDLAAGICLSKIEAQELVNLLRKKRHNAAYAGVSGIASQLKPYVKDVLHKYHTLIESKTGDTE
jgi:hypothetical protein